MAAVVATRAVWMLALRGWRPIIGGSGRADPLSTPELTILGVSGMRGALSLAGALSIPILVSGHPFPARDQVIFLVYVVVIGTLLGPSVCLEPLLRRLGLAGGEELRQDEIDARERVLRAELARLEELASQSHAPQEAVTRLRDGLELRLRRLHARAQRDDQSTESDIDSAVLSLRTQLIAAQRQTLAEMRSERLVPAQVLARIQRDVDLDEARLHT